MTIEKKMIYQHGTEIGQLNTKVENIKEDVQEIKGMMFIMTGKQDSILEYINTQKGQKIALIAFSGIAASMIVFVATWLGKAAAWAAGRI